MVGIDVELTVKDNYSGSYFRIPVLPEKIEYTDGPKMVQTVKIVGLGSVDIPQGVELDSVGWRSFFPARYDPSYCSHPEIHDPLTYRNQFSDWKDQGTSLQIICPTWGLNKTMYLASFTWSGEGFEGDIYYQLSFKELKTITPRVAQVGAIIPGASTNTPENRTAAATSGTPTTYTVQSGDNLTLIAKKLGIANWRDLYDKNRDVIGPNPNILQVGQVLQA